MIGIVANLTYLGIELANGYVDVNNIVGGPSYGVSETYPNGQWCVYLRYYSSQQARRDAITNSLPITETSLIQFVLPFQSGTDVVAAAKDVLKTWWPAGTIVDETVGGA